MNPMNTKSPEVIPLLLSVEATAKMLSVSRGQVYKWVEAGVLPRIPKEISARVLIPRVDVEAFAARAVKAA
jgi:excisionase family DNA binding protein